MANTDNPAGFRPLRHRGGGVIRPSRYYIASAYGTSIFTGDAVILTSGKVNIAADDSTLILGIFAGCEFLDSSGVPGARFSPYWPASTVTTGSADVVAWVYDDPWISYRVQTDTGTDFVVATHTGGSYDIELDHAGSTVTGKSGMEIDLNDTGQTQFYVVGMIEEIGNAAGTNTDIEVLIRKSILNQG
jgi:hypothetical protein